MAVSNDPTAATITADVPAPVAPRSFWGMLASHPPGFWFIFWGELAERCSYYGMMAILGRFISEQLGKGEADANTWVSFFKAGCYFFPLAGGYLADNFFGKYRLIVAFSIPYILGHVILYNETEWATIIALFLLAMGSGVIKPNISTLMGLTYDQHRPGDELLRTTAFSMFYMAINIGAAISIFTIPWVRTNYSYGEAFLVPAVLMAVSFVIFAIGKPFYATEVIAAREKSPAERQQQLHVVRQVAGLFLLAIFFWAVFDQTHTTWIFFANTHMDRTFFGAEFDPEQFGTLNPLLIILLVPVLTALWTVLARFGIRLRATDRMVIGFFLTAVTMGVMAYAGYMAGTGELQTITQHGKEVEMRVAAPADRVTIWWQVLAFFFVTIAEVLISVTGLELAFVVSPKSMKGFVTGLWLLTVGFANLFINAPVGRLYRTMAPGDYFAMLAGVMLVVAVASIFVARRFNHLAATAPPAPG